jgi:hypothetical protein
MPKMPAVGVYQQRTSASGPVGPGPVGDVGFDALSQVGRQMANDLQQVQAFQTQQLEERALASANDELQGARSDWSAQLEQRKAEAPAGAADFTKTVLTDFDADAKEREGRAKTPRARAALRERLAGVRLSIQEEGQAFEAASGLRDKEQKIASGIDKAQVAVGFRPQDFEQIHTETLTAIAGSGLSADQRVAQAQAATVQLARSAVAGMIRQDAKATLAELQNEKSENHAIQSLDPEGRAHLLKVASIEADNKVVEDATLGILGAFSKDTRAGQAALANIEKLNLTPAQQLEVRSKVQSGLGLQHAERRAQYAEQVNELERAIGAGAPGEKAEAAAAGLYRKGVYTPDQYTNVLQAIDGARVKAAKAGVDIAAVRNALATGARLDPKDTDIVKAVDTWFKETARVNQVPEGSEEWINSAAAIANRTNILPPEAMSWARKTILSGEPTLAVPAANAIARWADAAPHAYAYFDDPNLKAQAEQIDSLVRVGVPPGKAVEIARSNTFDIPKARQVELGEKYRKEIKATDNKSALSDLMDGDDAFEVGIAGTAPPPPLAMQDEYGALVRTYFDHTNGDIKRARALAWKDIRGTYGISTVNGEPEVLKLAPELVFKGIDPTVIRSDIDEVAKGLGVTTPVRLSPAPRLTGDTRGLIWNLTTVDEDGNIDVLLDENGRPRRYAIPTDTATYVKAQEDAKRKAVEQARASTAAAREQAEALGELGTFPGY